MKAASAKNETPKLDLAEGLGQSMHALAAEMYPICRSITGDGLRQTLGIIAKHIPLKVHEVPSGTKVFDWTVPKEWNIRAAHITGPDGKKVVDFADCNLHVVNYSAPVKKQRMPFAELKKHLFSLPKQPDLIPYRTSYYDETWGFCLSDRQLQGLKDGEYEVEIDSSLKDGSLSYGECFIPGETEQEIILSCHSCHPSLCNDNLAGIALATHIGQALQKLETRRYSYRLLFMPGTIGAITWLARNEQRVDRIAHGLVITCAGDAGRTNYKKTRRGNAEVDRAVLQVLKDSGEEFGVIDFFPYGYDERQFCSPGFNLAVGALMRTPHGQFPEYHTSADNLDFIKPAAMADSYRNCWASLQVLEKNRKFINLFPKCEPQLGRHGIFDAIRKHPDPSNFQMAILWVLNLSDGENDLLAIAERAKMKFEMVARAAEVLIEYRLVKAM